MIKNFCDTQQLLYDASFLNHDSRTDPKSTNAISRLAQTLVSVVGIEEAHKLVGMKSDVPIYGSFLNKKKVFIFYPKLTRSERSPAVNNLNIMSSHLREPKFILKLNIS